MFYSTGQQYYNSSYNSKDKQREIINISKIIYITGKKKMKTEKFKLKLQQINSPPNRSMMIVAKNVLR